MVNGDGDDGEVLGAWGFAFLLLWWWVVIRLGWWSGLVSVVFGWGFVCFLNFVFGGLARCHLGVLYGNCSLVSSSGLDS